MYQKEFEQYIKKSLPRSVLLYGKNEYLIEYYIRYYQKKLDAKESMLTLYYDEYDFEQAKSYLSQSSLFGGTNLLLIRDNKKLPAKELEQLIKYTQRSSDNYLIFAFDGEDRDAKSLQKSFTEKKGGVWVRFFEANPKEALWILENEARRLKIQSDSYTLSHLLKLLDNNLTLALKELEKLSIIPQPISTKDIDQLVYSTAPLAVEQLLIDLFNKKPINQTLERLLELGANEFEILRATQFFVNQIFLFHAYIRLNGLVDSKAILGYKLPRQIEDQRANLATRIKIETWNKIYSHLLESELRLKKSKSSYKETELYGILIKLQHYLEG